MARSEFVAGSAALPSFISPASGGPEQQPNPAAIGGEYPPVVLARICDAGPCVVDHLGENAPTSPFGEGTQMQVPAGRVVAVCVGSVRSRRARGRTHRTAFDKQPVAGPVPLHALGLAGDEHAYRHHGGEDQALLVYSRDHYPFWRNEYGLDLPEAGAFGENLTVEGLTESEVCIGDSFRIGSVVIQVTSPRSPCYKTGLRYGRSELPRAMQDTLRVGYLMRVVTGGEVAAGGRVELVERPGRAITVAEAARVFNRDRDDWEAVARLVAIPELAQAVRAKLRSRLASRNGGRDEDRLDGEGTGVSEA